MKCCFGGVKLRRNIPILKVYIKYFVSKTKQDQWSFTIKVLSKLKSFLKKTD